MSKWILGITGGIGSGKSLVTDIFIKLGIDAIDADHVARHLVAKGRPALSKIINHFGEHLLLADGNLDRTTLRHIIFNNKGHRQWLEQLLHPLIQQEICHFLKKATSPYAILTSPLLLETNQHLLVNRILVIDTSEEIQITRSTMRDNATRQQIKHIMQTQLPRNKRLAKADDIIVNDQQIDYLKQQVILLHQRYLTLSRNA